jgi:hypothetical protein
MVAALGVCSHICNIMTRNRVQCLAALVEHKEGNLGHEATLVRLVSLLKERPHLLCGLSLWVPPEKLKASPTPAYQDLQDGITDTLNRCKPVDVNATA